MLVSAYQEKKLNIQQSFFLPRVKRQYEFYKIINETYLKTHNTSQISTGLIIKNQKPSRVFQYMFPLLYTQYKDTTSQIVFGITTKQQQLSTHRKNFYYKEKKNNLKKQIFETVKNLLTFGQISVYVINIPLKTKMFPRYSTPQNNVAFFHLLVDIKQELLNKAVEKMFPILKKNNHIDKTKKQLFYLLKTNIWHIMKQIKKKEFIVSQEENRYIHYIFLKLSLETHLTLDDIEFLLNWQKG